MNFKRTYSGKLTLTVSENDDGLTIQLSKPKSVIVPVRKKVKWTWNKETQIQIIKELMSTGPVWLQELYEYMSAKSDSKQASIRGSIYKSKLFERICRGCWTLKEGR